MKTHLPVALRKALLAALVAVSYVYYSPAAAVEKATGDIDVAVMDNNTSDKTLYTGNGDVTIGEFSSVMRGSVAQGVDGLDIKAGAAGEEGKGNINIGTSQVAITNATMTADGNITFGETAGASEVLEVRGLDNDERAVSIKAEGDIVFNQTVEIHPGEGAHPSGNVSISAGGEMRFLGEKTTIQNGGTGNPATTTIEAGGPVEFENVNGTEIGSGVKFTTTGDESDVSITTNGVAQTNLIAGTVASAGEVSVFGSTNRILEQSGKASIHAADGISVTATKENSTQNAELKSQNGPLTLTVQVSEGDEGYNMIYSSSLEVAGEGNVEISGGDAYLRSASVAARQDDVSISGGHVLVGQSLSDTSASTLDAAGKIDVAGATVSIKDSTSIDSVDGNVTITASGSDTAASDGTTSALSVKGGNVSSQSGDVMVAAENGTAALADTLVEGKNITTSGKTGTELKDTTVDGSDVVKVASEATTQVQESIIRGANTTVSGEETNIALSEVSADETVTITGTTTAQVINSELSGDAVNLNGGALTLQDATSVKAKADDGDITVAAASLTIGKQGGTAPVDSMTAKKNVDITVTDSSTIQGAAQVAAETGAVAINGGTSATNLISGTGTTVEAEGTDGMVDMDGKSNTIAAAATVTAAAGVEMDASVSNRIEGGAKLTATSGNVTMTAATQNTVADATVTADNGSIAMGGAAGSTETVQNEVTAAAGKSTTLTAELGVNISGKNSISGSAPGDVGLQARNGDISIHGNNEIQHAGITAAGGVSVSTGTGDKTTQVADTDISGRMVTIAGDTADDRSDANLAVVTGAKTRITSRGEDDGAGITLNNVSVLDTVKGAANIKAENGDHIDIRNRVDVFNGTLTIQSSDSYDSGAGRIVVDGSNVLNMKADSSLEGRLSGAGSINKSGGDELLLDRDHRDFSGTIYANGAGGGPEGSVADADNAGSWIQVTGAGVGAGAKMVLKNTDLIVATGETQIGTLDTTQDATANNAATGGTLYGENLYTSDERTRADFKTIGSVIEVNKGSTGDVVHATDMKLSDATLMKLDVAVNNDGSVISDRIAATGTVNAAAATGLNSTSTATAPSTARVFANLDAAAAASAAEGARTTILTGTLAAPINEDVLYEVKKAANGTYQRTLQDRNVHLENKGDRVDLVFSKNYRSAAKTAPMQKVAEAIRQYSDAFHHSEGWLAASDDRMAKLVDAFDYTRSEAAAQHGLQSLAGTGNVLPQLMLFDSSRHHLNQLRKQMEMPVCPRTWKGAPTRKSNAWLAYTGAYDSLNGDANMGDYTRSAHGAMMGVDTALTCKLRAGLSLGYETASGEADSAKVDADSIFVDAYATAYTGHIKHRASIGLALTSFDSRRGVEVEAGYHSFHGSARSDTDALTLNFGYEISSDYKLSERSWLTRYAAINLAWHTLDDMKESGLGEIGLVSEYDSEWQAGVAVGLAYNREFAAVKYEAPAVFSAHAAVHFELLADKAAVNNRFSGLEGSWEAHSMDREQLYLELGVGVMVPLSPAWTATAGAAVEVGADRSAFSGNVGVRYAF
ncbi:MAG: autotransporter domain-containing protein [Akkermansia sp.]|nr:autotransporter domain-containing protein [Akkermansia sp.]